jgi:ribosomal protein L19
LKYLPFLPILGLVIAKTGPGETIKMKREVNNIIGAKRIIPTKAPKISIILLIKKYISFLLFYYI